MSRISDLPRRCWKARVDPYVEPLSALYRAPGGTQSLRPVQAAALLEGAEQGGLFLNGRMGIGKTLTLALMPRVLEDRYNNNVRALILVPGGILKDTQAHWAEMREHWQLPPRTNYEMKSYSALSRMPAKNQTLQDFFGGRGPNVILCDEADSLRNAGKGGAARAVLVSEWMLAHPGTFFGIATGTCDVQGLTDYGHLMHWALRSRSPMPTSAKQLQEWHEVLDEEERGQKAGWVCQDLGLPRQSDTKTIRAAYKSRLWETPGVIICDDPYAESELIIREHVVEAPALEPHFAKLRDFWERPDGMSVDGTKSPESEPDAVLGTSIWPVARRMGRGLCYYADPKPPQEWLEARRRYHRWVRRQSEKGEHLTELTARQHAIENNVRQWLDWEAIADTYTPTQHTMWLDDTVLQWAIDWGQKSPGLIWVVDVAFGVELARRTGWSYYSGDAKDQHGKRIPSGKRKSASKVTAIAAVKSCGTGLNLQFGWHRNLLVTPLNTARDFDQVIGRTHREGQPQPEVFVDILLTCAEDFDSMRKVRGHAVRSEESLYSSKAAQYDWPKAMKPKGTRAFST